MSESLTLKNKVALITGAGRGIGAETALYLAKKGADIVINDLNLETAQQVAKKVEALGQKVFINNHDISLYDQAQNLVTDSLNQFGRVDILVNNAGITRDAMLHKLSEELWDQVINVNLKGTFNVGQACAKVMMEQKSGVIVNLSSVAHLGNVGQTNYAASKAGVIGLTRTWALELSRSNIRVNAIAPGLIDSALTQQIPSEIKNQFEQKIPLKRIGNPLEVAKLVYFLASDDSSYITGQCFHIDGGLSVGI